MTSSSSLPPSLEFAVLRGAMEEVPVGVATLSGDTIHHANSALETDLRAKPGELDGCALEKLFDELSWAALRDALKRHRTFDGRLKTRTLSGEELRADVHAERYQAESGEGGFLILRDVSLEMSALSRLVAMLGGAAFRVNVDHRAFEFVSPRIVDLIELDPLRLLEDPASLQSLISPADQTRLGGIYQQVVRGREPTAEAEVVVRLSGGRSDKLTIRITGRSDTAGVVRHVDGVVTSEGVATPRAFRNAHPPSQFSGLSTALRLLDASNDLLREAAQLTTSASADLRGIKALVQSAALPSETVQEITTRLDTLGSELSASNAISRRVRRAMDGRPSKVRLNDLLDNVRVNLTPIFDGRRIVVSAPTAKGIELDTRVDEVTVALMQLVLRTHHLVARGDVTLTLRPQISASREAFLDIVGEASPVPSSGPRTPDSAHRGMQTDKRLSAAASLLSEVGCRIEADALGENSVRTVVALCPVTHAEPDDD